MPTPLRFTLFKGSIDQIDRSRDPRIWLCLTGDLMLAQVDPCEDPGEEVRLTAGDLQLVNAGTACRIRAQDARLIRFELSQAELEACFPDRVLAFACSSVTGGNDSVSRLLDLLREVVAVTYEHDELAGAETRRIFYQIAALLMGRFSVSVDRGTTNRVQAMRAFIIQHLAEDLSVERMSRAFFLTPQYFSKYFKEQTGETFHRYVARLRVERAAADLAQGDETILRIALDNGFPNAESLRRAFGRAYGMTPSAYRQQRRTDASGAPSVDEGSLEEAIELLGGRPRQTEAGEELLEVDASHQQVIDPYWRDAVNLGELVVLENFEVHEQFTHFLDALRFSYVRFGVSHAFTAGDEGLRRRALFFERQQVDHFYNLGVRPWIMIEYTRDVPHERYEDYLRGALSHYANRMDRDNVLQWRFELSVGPGGMDDPEGFVACFERLSDILSAFGHREGLIGPNLPLKDHAGAERWAAALERAGVLPVVQTFRVGSDVPVTMPSGRVSHRASDSSYIKDQLHAFERGFPRLRAGIEQIRITEWESSYGGPSLLNDSCFRGAAFIKNLIDGIGDISSLAPSRLLDVMDPFSQQRGALFGGDGLVSRHGIPKPPFFAYELMNRLGRSYIGRGAHAAVFSNGVANYQVICHNCKRLSLAYYANEEEPGVDGLAGMFEDERALEIRVRITGVNDGTYQIKTRSVSAEAGSVQDELLRMGAVDTGDLHPNDLEYLRRVITPRITLARAEARGGVLELPIHLAANEIACVHAIYQF